MHRTALNFRLTRRINFPTYWPELGVDPKTPSKRLFPTPYTYENLLDSSCFTATESLYTGPNKWSQVYRGSLTSPSLGSFNDVVLKVFSSTHFPHAHSDLGCLSISPPDTISPNSYRYTDELMAWAEVYAYRKLYPLQGATIPRFFDALMVQSPESGEESIGIIISHIKGISIVARCLELGGEIDGDTRWYPLARELYRNIYRINQLGICGLDIRDANVRVVEPGGCCECGPPSVVLFDFAFSRPNFFFDDSDRKRHRVEAVMIQDLFDLKGLTANMCGGGIGSACSAQGVRARRWAFLEWVRQEHPDDQWIAAWAPHFVALKPGNPRN
ncbi:hypothetical protein GALMADRAFT_213421 [Galerina marginata CBS 339.88]|uniref:Protein kinase domain-containing protein n=1 Tax=Galerina marginata (strain CBS 339.88) TaxID=685588 RepID=A0A067SNJ5_GALM3|nr:hypothetical protein GALMADRAFT_213421 [Galerina marginata CBS 339.88]